MSKLPTIELVGANLSQKYLDWINKNPGIPRTIPPLYRDFVLRHTREYFDSARDKSPRTHAYMECVHYSDDLAEMEISHVLDGKKILRVSSRYADYDGVSVRVTVAAPTSTPYDHGWLQREGLSAVYTVLAVQAYILYHRPDIVPVELPAAEHRPAKKPGGASKARTIAPGTQRRFIRLTEEDKIPAVRNYKTIQWTVRGHYRRLRQRDGTTRLVYVSPHLAKRGSKKSPEIKWIMKGEQKNGES